nr:unnamed protein product [Digitaria exilis]
MLEFSTPVAVFPQLGKNARQAEKVSESRGEARADHAGAAAGRVFPRAAPLPAHALDLLRVQGVRRNTHIPFNMIGIASMLCLSCQQSQIVVVDTDRSQEIQDLPGCPGAIPAAATGQAGSEQTPGSGRSPLAARLHMDLSGAARRPPVIRFVVPRRVHAMPRATRRHGDEDPSQVRSSSPAAQHQYMMLMIAAADYRPVPLQSHHTHAAAARGDGKWTPTPCSCLAPTAPSPARSTSAAARRPGPAPAGGPPPCSCSVRSPLESRVEIAERFAYHGVSANLISYLTGPLGESTAGAAAAINAWSGVATMLPLLMACVADAWLGRYRTIVLASLLFVVVSPSPPCMGMLTVSALPVFQHDGCSSHSSKSVVCSSSPVQVAIFYVSLYLVALAEAGHKPCAQAFGADQFDQHDPEESVSRSSFFNWWYFGMCSGTAVTTMVSSYIQDNVGWGLGFGIPCLVMVFALLMFLLGTRNYRYYTSTESSPFARLARAFVALITGSKSTQCDSLATTDGAAHREEVKSVIRLFPIWATCIIYAVIFSQSSTFFTKQAATLDRRIFGSTLRVPPAALQTFISLTIMAFIPIYDRAFVPLARRFTRLSSGITMLQRIGTGLVLAMVAMVVAAMVEMRRLGVARDAGLVDQPKASLPMTLWWMLPQYVLFGLSDVFAMIGLQEFFYDQVPDALRSLGLAFFLSIFGVGHFLSSFLISAIDGATNKSGASWFSNNLNRAHLDYFYWLLAGLCAVELAAFVVVSRVYVYKKRVSHDHDDGDATRKRKVFISGGHGRFRGLLANTFPPPKQSVWQTDARKAHVASPHKCSAPITATRPPSDGRPRSSARTKTIRTRVPPQFKHSSPRAPGSPYACRSQAWAPWLSALCPRVCAHTSAPAHKALTSPLRLYLVLIRPLAMAILTRVRQPPLRLYLVLIRPLAMADTVAGAADYRGQPASRAATGGWKSSAFVMAMEIAERFAYKGVAANLITYLTGPLGQPMARAAASIDAWKGVSQMLPLPLACLADAWIGRFRAIILASLIFVVSMGALSVSSAFPAFRSGHVAIFYVALYLVALGEGAHKPCAQAFAADQFDEKDPKESVARSSFFNWWYFGMCAGTAVTTMVSSYVQDNVGWGLGFGIPCIVIVASLAVFLLGSRSYRYYTTTEASPFSHVAKAFLALAKSWTPNRGDCEATAVEEVKSVLRLLPIWASCIIYAIIFSQTSTFFTKQAATLDRRIGARFKVPPAALQTFISVSIVVFIPAYDRLFVPLARRYTGRPTGITMLQRIGAGLALSLVAVAMSALVEMKRLAVARDAGMATNTPKGTHLPMSLWWMVPQYVLIGVSDVFAMIGLQEFFYDQVPDAARSLGLALFLSIFGVGHLLSSLLISVIDKATAKSGTSWFSNNLNRAHLDYFYWLLTALCAVELVCKSPRDEGLPDLAIQRHCHGVVVADKVAPPLRPGT